MNWDTNTTFGNYDIIYSVICNNNDTFYLLQ